MYLFLTTEFKTNLSFSDFLGEAVEELESAMKCLRSKGYNEAHSRIYRAKDLINQFNFEIYHPTDNRYMYFDYNKVMGEF